MKHLSKIYVTGGTCSGKSTLLKDFEAQGLRIARNFTTRKRREGEGLLEYYFLNDIAHLKLQDIVYVTRYYQGYYGLTVNEFLASDVVVASTLAMANILAWITSECILEGYDIAEVLENSTIYLLDSDLDTNERYMRAIKRDGKEEAKRRFISENFTHSHDYLTVWFEYANVLRYENSK
jgi:guanylate kinase